MSVFQISCRKETLNFLAPNIDNNLHCDKHPCAIHINTNSSFIKNISPKIKINPFSKKIIVLLSQFNSPANITYNEI